MDDLPNHFKFIPTGFKFDLSIPKSFLSKLNGSSRCKEAILRRGHNKWSVHINMSDGGVFGDGWRKFVTDNGVQELDFIVFKHHGNMVFECFVFDKSTCERHFPYPNILEDVKESLTESSDSLHIHKRLKMTNTRTTGFFSESNDESRVDDNRCFVAIMTPNYIRNQKLNVPIKFARSNGLFTQRITQIVIVDEAQRTWPASLRFQTDRINLTGYRKLILKNHVKVGDACKFELVKPGQLPVYKFYNLGKKPNNNHIQVKKETGLTKKETSCSTHHFISTLKPHSFTKQYLHVPKKFAVKSGLLLKEEMILKNANECSWIVKIKHRKSRYRCYIARGWRAFWVANRLKEGDRFKLELVSNGEKPVAYFYSLNSC